MPSTYNVITDRILAQLEKGVVPWRKPWREASCPKSLVSQKEYRGINLFLLNAAGYASPYWLTVHQANGLGARIRKGEHGMPVVFWLWQSELKDPDDGGEPTKGKDKPVMCRYYTVFNVEQVENLKIDRALLFPQNTGPGFSIPLAEAIYQNYQDAPVVKDGPAAYYQPSLDVVTMPARESFESAEEYYCVLFHELGHSTGHAKRLNREEIATKHGFGSDPYAREELVAEMTAAFLCGHVGIDTVTLDNSASYIAGWKAKLRADNQIVIRAASRAQKAADYIIGRGKGVQVNSAILETPKAPVVPAPVAPVPSPAKAKRPRKRCQGNTIYGTAEPSTLRAWYQEQPEVGLRLPKASFRVIKQEGNGSIRLLYEIPKREGGGKFRPFTFPEGYRKHESFPLDANGIDPRDKYSEAKAWANCLRALQAKAS